MLNGGLCRRVVPGVCTLVLTGLVYASPVRADPIRVTAGLVSAFVISEPSGADLLGDGLRLGADGIGSAAQPSRVGELASLDGDFHFQPTVNLLNVTVDGVPYRATLGGTLTFTTVPFVAPAPVDGLGNFTTPFTMSGHVTGFSGIGTDARELFSVDLSGSGTASARGVRFIDEVGVYLSRDTVVSYTFTNDVAATPEPASLLLLGSGVAGLFLRSRKHT